MKIKNLFISLLAVFGMLYALVGCSLNTPNIIITDYGTNNVVTQFSSKDYTEEAAALTNALNYNDEISENIKSDPEYTVHFIDPKNSAYDVWYFVYIENDTVYVQYNTEKMQQMNDDIFKSETMTVDKFMEILSIK